VAALVTREISIEGRKEKVVFRSRENAGRSDVLRISNPIGELSTAFPDNQPSDGIER
jgi:hypothetical protein